MVGLYARGKVVGKKGQGRCRGKSDWKGNVWGRFDFRLETACMCEEGHKELQGKGNVIGSAGGIEDQGRAWVDAAHSLL